MTGAATDPFCRIVEEAGMRALEAADGTEGLETRRLQRPDVVLPDWNMPRMDGIECPKAIRGRSGETLPRVILCTTTNDPGHITTAIEAGAQEFVMKPFDAELLLGKIADVSPQAGEIH